MQAFAIIPNDPYDSYDGSHLVLESAVAFSRDLAGRLRALLE